MDVDGALIVMSWVFTALVGVVAWWAHARLRQTFHKQTLKQVQHTQKCVEMVEALTKQLEEANTRIHLLTEQGGRLTRAVTGLMDKSDDDKNRPAVGDGPRLLH